MRPLHCPFPSRSSPHEREIEERLWAWAKAYDLLEGDAARKLMSSRLGMLVGRAFPAAPLERVMLAAEWTAWLFLHDDRCDEARIGRRPQELRAENDALLRVLLRHSAPTDTYSCALADLRDRLGTVAPPRVAVRFIDGVMTYFEGCEWEATNRTRAHAPSTATYRRMRLFTGALSTYFALTEAIEQITLSLEARSDETLIEMSRLANAAICLSNDLFSAYREMEHGELHNLVLLLVRERGIPFEVARAEVADEHDACVRRFVTLRDALSQGDGDVECGVERYVDALGACMRANLDWSASSTRYHVPDQAGERLRITA